MLSFVFSPRFDVSFLKVWRPMVVDTERGARGKKKEDGTDRARGRHRERYRGTAHPASADKEPMSHKAAGHIMSP